MLAAFLPPHPFFFPPPDPSFCLASGNLFDKPYHEKNDPLDLPRTQDASHHQDDTRLLAGNPNLNLYLPLASWVRGCSYPIYPIIPWKKPILFTPNCGFCASWNFPKRSAPHLCRSSYHNSPRAARNASTGPGHVVVTDIRVFRTPSSVLFLKIELLQPKKIHHGYRNHCFNIQFFQKSRASKNKTFIHALHPPTKKKFSLIHHLDLQQKIREVQLLLPSNHPPSPPDLSTCAPVDCCPVWRQKLHEAASGTKAWRRIRSRKSMESLWVSRCLEQF